MKSQKLPETLSKREWTLIACFQVSGDLLKYFFEVSTNKLKVPRRPF